MNDHDDNLDVRHLCPLPHRGHPPDIHPPATICHHHAQRIHDTITDITRLWDQLDDLAGSASNGGCANGYVSTPPARLDIIALTDPHTHDGDIPNAVTTLTTLANWIAQRRRLTPTTTATAALQLLTVHHLALTDYDHPLDAHHELRTLRSYLRRLAGENRHIVATCQQPHPDPQSHDDQCGGPIYWTGRQTGVIAECQTCGDEWTDHVIDLHQQQEALRAERQT